MGYHGATITRAQKIPPQLHNANGEVVAVFTNGTPQRRDAEFTPGVLKVASRALSIADDIVITHAYVWRRQSASGGRTKDISWFSNGLSVLS